MSRNSRAVIGDAREDRRTVTNHRATQGGHIHMDGRRATRPPEATGSRGSIQSIGSRGSIQSIGSRGSILSIGSAGSVLSIGSAGSVLSIGSAGSVLSIGSLGSLGAIGGRGDMADRLVGPAATVLGLSALVSALRTLRH
jgi:hypothetical protein